MKRLNIGYIVDHPKRDLPGAIQFARALLKHRSETYIIPLYEQALDIPLLPLDAIVVNFARPANLELVQSYKAMGLPVFVLDTEGGNQTVAGSNTPERLASLLQERGYAPLLAGYFFWGPALRDTFVGKSGMPADHLFTSGCPRFDYASARWQKALSSRSHGSVLVNANFPLVNPRFAASEGAERNAMISAGWEAGYVDRLMDELKVALQSFTDAVAQLAKDLPDVRFLLRPHPFEDVSFYHRRLGTLSNVDINGDGDVLAVLANSHCLLHLNCATAIEATMLGRLPVSLEYLNTPTLLNHAPLPSQISRRAASYEDALNLLRNIPAATEAFDFTRPYEQFVHPWFYKNDGKAADRMAEVLLQHVEPRSKKRSITRALSASRNRPRFVHYLQGIAANVVGSLALSRLRSLVNRKRRDKHIDIGQVEAALNRLREIEPEHPAAVIRRATHPVTGLPLSSISCSPR